MRYFEPVTESLPSRYWEYGWEDVETEEMPENCEYEYEFVIDEELPFH